MVVDDFGGHALTKLDDGPYRFRDLVCGDDQGLFHQNAVDVTSALFRQLRDGKKHILFAVQIDYQDIYCKAHRLRFSVYLSGADLKRSRHNAEFMETT